MCVHIRVSVCAHIEVGLLGKVNRHTDVVLRHIEVRLLGEVDGHTDAILRPANGFECLILHGLFLKALLSYGPSLMAAWLECSGFIIHA